MKTINTFLLLLLTIFVQTEQLLCSLVKTPTSTALTKITTPTPLPPTIPAPTMLKSDVVAQVPKTPEKEDLLAVKKLPPLNETLGKLLYVIEKSSKKRSRPKGFDHALRLSKIYIKTLKKKLEAESPEINLITNQLYKLNEDIDALLDNLIKEANAGNRKKIKVDGKQIPQLSQFDIVKQQKAFNTFKEGVKATSLPSDFKDKLTKLSDLFNEDFANKALYPALSFSQSIEGYFANMQQKIEEALEEAQEDKFAAAKKLMAYASMLATTYFAYREKVFERPLDMVRDFQWKAGLMKRDASSLLWTMLHPRAAGKRFMDNIYGRVDELPNNITFENDIIGLTKVVDELKKYAKVVNTFKKGTSTTPKTFLLYGPPGSGKSWLAIAFAKESNVSIFTEKLASLNRENWSGLDNLFYSAQSKPKSVVFIDEVDKLSDKRQHELLQHISAEVDAAKKGDRLTVIIATANDIKAPDKGGHFSEPLLSRFSEQFKIGPPNKEEIKEIIVQLLTRLTKHNNVKIEEGLIKDNEIQGFDQIIEGLKGVKVSRRALGQAIDAGAYASAQSDKLENNTKEVTITRQHVENALKKIYAPSEE